MKTWQFFLFAALMMATGALALYAWQLDHVEPPAVIEQHTRDENSNIEPLMNARFDSIETQFQRAFDRLQPLTKVTKEITNINNYYDTLIHNDLALIDSALRDRTRLRLSEFNVRLDTGYFGRGY